MSDCELTSDAPTSDADVPTIEISDDGSNPALGLGDPPRDAPCADAASACSEEEDGGDASPPPAAVTVRSLPGEVLAVFEPGPASVKALREAIHQRTSCPPSMQRLVLAGAAQPIKASDRLASGERLEVTLVVDETPLYTWDLESNPCKHFLERDGFTVRCPKLRTDYVNVLTKEPLRNGAHYFQFVMHSIGDEQWCGVVSDTGCAGSTAGGRSLRGWTYYCGRMPGYEESIVDGRGALHVGDRAVAPFKTPRPSGDVIGMLLDLDAKAVAFDLNGEVQGACAVTESPLWVVTHLDEPGDCVELRKPSLAEAPAATKAALAGPLFDLSQGARLPWLLANMSSDESELTPYVDTSSGMYSESEEEGEFFF